MVAALLGHILSFSFLFLGAVRCFLLALKFNFSCAILCCLKICLTKSFVAVTGLKSARVCYSNEDKFSFVDADIGDSDGV